MTKYEERKQYFIQRAAEKLDIAQDVARKQGVSLLEALEAMKLVALEDQEETLESLAQTIGNVGERLASKKGR